MCREAVMFHEVVMSSEAIYNLPACGLGSADSRSIQIGVEVDQNIEARQFYAETYDAWMSDWAGEMDFYRGLAAEEVKCKEGIVLDVACGTGRIGLRLAEDGIFVIGLDRSPDMLAIARQKSANMDRIGWVEGDMRSFDLDKIFDLVVIPSHSFQNLNTAADQAACIECIWRHLKPGGLLIVHLDHMNADTSWSQTTKTHFCTLKAE